MKLAKYYHRAPDQLTNEEVQVYLAHLIQERKLSWSTCSQAAHAFRFLYHVTLGREKTAFHVPAPKQPQKLPDILSREEVWRLLRACTHPWKPGRVTVSGQLGDDMPKGTLASVKRQAGLRGERS